MNLTLHNCLRACAILVLTFMVGCASMPDANDPEAVAAYQEANDPLEPMNRFFFDFNRDLDSLFLRPIAEIYRGTLPSGVRDSVRNFLNNLAEPVTFFNDILQGNFDRAGNTFGRFVGNTLFGIGGLFNVVAPDSNNLEAEDGIPYHFEDFGQTLAVYGVDEGPYLVLPFFGPRPPRDLAGTVVDVFLDPFTYLIPKEHRFPVGATRLAIGIVDTRSRNIETLDEIERSSIDYYAAIRSLYRQVRGREIRNGALPPLDELPDLSDDLEDDLSGERISLATP